MVSARLTRVVTTALIALAATFVALPLVAIIARVPLGAMVEQFASEALRDALRISILSSLIGHLFVLGVGTPVAWALVRNRFPGRGLLVALLELPIMLPPAVAGIGLLAAFGRNGLLGGTLDAFGVRLPFTFAAVVVAVVFISGSLYLRQAVAAFEAIDSEFVDAARTLGCSPAHVLVRVAIPLALPGLEAGSALALARGFGEFGATIMFAGSMPGVTQTLPLDVYTLLDTDFEAALAASTVLIAIGIAMLVVNRRGIAWANSRVA